MPPSTFFQAPILNSPYAVPARHWDLDADGRPTDTVVPSRRSASLVSAIPAPRRRARSAQAEMVLDTGHGLSTEAGEFNPTPIINDLRRELEVWRQLPNPAQWQVSPVTATLLKHWRSLQADAARAIRPFYCQMEAVEAAIWLAEVAPKLKRGRRFLDWLALANASTVGEGVVPLPRVALKLATGAGKTTVMAMLIAWQAINAARSRNSKQFARGFLLIAPGITIRDRLRVLLPSDPGNLYRRLDLVPTDMMPELGQAKIVVTNYHAFGLRETLPLARGTRQALAGHGEAIVTVESDGEMLARVCRELLAIGPVLVLNDEAHHCYREKPGEAASLTADERAEAKDNEEAARLWISGIEALARKVGLAGVYDLSATPFFLAGSGWPEGTLFPWVVSDFSLMDAIESGIVKLPRVPVADNLASGKVPLYRNLWPTIRDRMRTKGRGIARPDPRNLPLELQVALDALYGHYEKTFDEWRKAGVGVPPVFIVICNDTLNSELVSSYIAGFERETEDGETVFTPGRLELFRNYTDGGDRLARPRTLLIDSQRIDRGDAIDARFRDAYAEEIAAFRREKAAREGAAAEGVTDEEILREVLNTVGKAGRLGAQVRCVVSVSMLTEGWDANTVTHILGLRAFSTRLISEQVIGRALRRLSYDVHVGEDGIEKFGVEYADIMGIDELNFAAQAIRAEPPKPPREVVHVAAVSPERDALEILFPRVEGYRIELPEGKLVADFSQLEPYVLDPDKVGATEVVMSGIVGKPHTLDLAHVGARRQSEIVYALAARLSEKLGDGAFSGLLFQQCTSLAKQWLAAGLLVCRGGTYPGQITYKQLADEVSEQIVGSVRLAEGTGDTILRAVLDPYAPTGSTADVSFNATAANLFAPRPDRSHVNWIVLDSEWEAKLALVLEAHPRVLAYAKNHNLGLEVPYRREDEPRRYRPDYLARVDDGVGGVTLVLEVKGFRGHDVPLKTAAMRDRWVPAVNRLERFGRWDFAELREPYGMAEELEAVIAGHVRRGAA